MACSQSAAASGYSVLPSSPPLDEALLEQQQTTDTEAHFSWLVPLLNEYYDPMYRYQLGKKAEKIIFRGSWQEVAAWLAE